MSGTYVVVTLRFKSIAPPSVNVPADSAAQKIIETLYINATLPEFEQETRQLSFRNLADVRALVSEYQAQGKVIVNLIPVGAEPLGKSDRLHAAFFGAIEDAEHMSFNWSGWHSNEPLNASILESLSRPFRESSLNFVLLGAATLPLSS